MKHRAEKKLLCKTCLEFVCPMCLGPQGEHQGHEYCLREKGGEYLQHALEDMLLMMDNALPKDVYEEALESQKAIHKDLDRVNHEIDEEMTKVMDAVDGRKEELLEQLDGHMTSVIGGLEAQASLLQESQKKAMDLLSRADEYLACIDTHAAEVPEILKLVWDLHRTVPEMEELLVQYVPENTKYRFVTQGNSVIKDIGSYGSVSVETEGIPHRKPPPVPSSAPFNPYGLPAANPYQMGQTQIQPIQTQMTTTNQTTNMGFTHRKPPPVPPSRPKNTEPLFLQK